MTPCDGNGAQDLNFWYEQHTQLIFEFFKMVSVSYLTVSCTFETQMLTYFDFKNDAQDVTPLRPEACHCYFQHSDLLCSLHFFVRTIHGSSAVNLIFLSCFLLVQNQCILQFFLNCLDTEIYIVSQNYNNKIIKYKPQMFMTKNRQFKTQLSLI